MDAIHPVVKAAKVTKDFAENMQKIAKLPSDLATEFRYTPKTGHRRLGRLCRFRANRRHHSGLVRVSAQGSAAPSAAATLFMSARVRTTMSPARLPSLAILLSACRTTSRSGD